MKLPSKLFFLLGLIGVAGFGAPAHAYLDPGTGSMIVQLLLGGVAGALVIGKLYWARLTAMFGFGRPRSQDEAGEPAARGDAE